MRAGSLRIAIAIAIDGLTGCRSPTQIDVVVSTDLPCSQVSATSVTTGTLGQIESLPPASTTDHCSSGQIGSVVLIPSGDDQALVAFKVVTAINGEGVEQCTPDDAGSYGANCIVARRAIRYLPHTSLQVDVLMAGECAGKACDPTSTCVEGACVPATISDPSQCEGDGCNQEVLTPDGGLPDATVPTDSGGAIDAGGLDSTIMGEPDASTEAGGIDASFPLDSGPPSIVPGCDVAGALAGAAWPMEGYCPSHRNRSPFVGPPSAPKQKWERTFGGGSVIAPPSVGPDGTVYVAAFGTGAQNAVYALDPITGDTVWQYAPNTGATFDSIPLLAADHTARIVDLALGTYTILDLDGGGVKSSVPLATAGDPQDPLYVRGGLTVVGNGTIFGSDNEGHVFQASPNGTVGWVTPNASSDFVLPTIEPDGTVVTTTSTVNAFNGSTGAVAWAYDAAAPVQLSTAAMAVDGTLRVASPGEGKLYAFEADGGLKWVVPTEQGEANVLAVGDDGTTYLGAADDLIAYDATGKQTAKYAGPCDLPIIDAAGNLYDTCSGFVVKLDAALNLVWSMSLPFDPAQAVNDSLIIGPGGTLFVSLDTENSSQPDGGPPDMVIGLVP